VSNKTSITVVAVICAAIGSVLWLIARRSRPVEIVLPTLSDVFAQPNTRILDALETGNDPRTTVSPGFEVRILRLAANDGNYIDILVKEGDFSPTDVDPHESWFRYLNSGDDLVVNSVDDEQLINSKETTISYSIGHGCNLGGSVRQMLWPGEVSLHDCQRSYPAVEAQDDFKPVGECCRGYLETHFRS
jgi:hypothetical protein